jgi:uncharacterized LabA/DUF88 family protein
VTPFIFGGAGQGPTTYLFIDAAYLEEECVSQAGAFFGEVPTLDLRRVREDAVAQRAFYYQCVDDVAGQGESAEELAARITAQDAELARISRLPNFHVREGVIRGVGRRRRRQKKVDVQLAVDMLMSRVQGVMDRAVLIAGDLDFLPVVQSLVQLGAHVTVWHGERAPEDLLAGADDSVRLDVRRFHGWADISFRTAHPIPTAAGNEGPPAGPENRSGLWNGRRIRVFSEPHAPGRRTIFIDPTPHEVSLKFVFDDEEKLLQFFTMVYGQPDWES